MSASDPESAPTNSYWDGHWDRYSEATRLNPGQRYRRKLILRLLGASASRQDARILDIGCGAGDLLESIAAHCPKAQIGGIDRSQAGLDVTARLLANARLQKVDLESQPFDAGELAGWASHMVCSEVLEHMENPVTVLENLSHFLKPDGILVITVPGGPKSAFDKSIGHFRHYSADKIRDDLQQAGYRVELASGAGFPVFNLYRLVVLLRGEKLSSDIDGKPSLLARLVMTMFRAIIGCSLFKSSWGWQIIAIARKVDT